MPMVKIKLRLEFVSYPMLNCAITALRVIIKWKRLLKPSKATYYWTLRKRLKRLAALTINRRDLYPPPNRNQAST